MKEPEKTYYAFLYLETQLEGTLEQLKMKNYDFVEERIASICHTVVIQAESFRKWLEKNNNN